MHNHHLLSRRDFLRTAGLAIGGVTLACAGSSKIIELTATPTLIAPPTQAMSTMGPGDVVDTILVNGNIVTIDSKRSIARALAVKDGVIQWVGDDQAVRNLAGAGSQVIDLAGRTVTPGLIDSHCHVSACGLLSTVYVDISWPGIKTIEEMQSKIAERVAATPTGEWVVGAGWFTFGGRYPNKHDVDPVSPNHPIMMINQGGHMAVVNSLALEMAGVNANTRDPANGKFMREANGDPDGLIMNHPAMDYFRRLWPDDMIDQKTMETTILSPQAKFASLGVTSFQDVYARDMDRMLAYFNIGKRHEMTIRGQVMNVLEYIQELDGRIPAIEAMRYEDDFMHFAGGKCQVDGAGEASYTHEPHNGISWNMSIWKPKDLNEVVRAFHDGGYQISLHAFGDAAVDMALDSIEAAMNANPRPDPRHRIEHSVLNTPAALQRQKDLGVVISTQPTLIQAFGDGAERIWGTERMHQMVPTRTWLDMGIPLCLGSDAPSMPWWDPQSTLYASIVRNTPSKKPVSPEQALTIEEAMVAHTISGAYADFAEKKKGSLEVGKLADLVVWNDDPYTVATADLPKLTIDLTMVGGKVVHQV